MPAHVIQTYTAKLHVNKSEWNKNEKWQQCLRILTWLLYLPWYSFTCRFICFGRPSLFFHSIPLVSVISLPPHYCVNIYFGFLVDAIFFLSYTFYSYAFFAIKFLYPLRVSYPHRGIKVWTVVSLSFMHLNSIYFIFCSRDHWGNSYYNYS